MTKSDKKSPQPNSGNDNSQSISSPGQKPSHLAEKSIKAPLFQS